MFKISVEKPTETKKKKISFTFHHQNFDYCIIIKTTVKRVMNFCHRKNDFSRKFVKTFIINN